MRNALAFAAVAALAACSGGTGPAPLDTRNEACALCRMAVSDARFAAQVVAPREDPRFFDDVGCLRDWLRERGGVPPAAVAYVADHRTRAWVRASDATFTRVAGLHTPMASHLVAHADAASRDRDLDARGGEPVPAPEILGAGRGP
jgi:copper chaperone NosL